MESYPYPVKEGKQYINLNPGGLYVKQPPQKRDWEAHLNYYVSAYNGGRQLSHYITKLNQTRQNKHASLTKNTYNTKSTHKNLKPCLVAPMTSGLETEWEYSVEWEWKEEQENKESK